MSAAEGVLTSLLRQSLAQVLARAKVCEAGGGEAVRRLRVSLRRLRSLLALVREEFPGPDVEALRAEAKRLANLYAEARDWQAFADLAAEAAPQPGLEAVIAEAEARARKAEGEAHLDPTALARQLRAYLHAPEWGADEPADAFAARALERAFRRLKKRARDFARLSAAQRHEARVALKRLRYAVEFFGPLFGPSESVEAFTQRAAQMQDRLGADNDAAVALRLAQRLEASGNPALALAAGALARHVAPDGTAARRAWKRLRKAPRFWRGRLAQNEA